MAYVVYGLAAEILNAKLGIHQGPYGLARISSIEMMESCKCCTHTHTTLNNPAQFRMGHSKQLGREISNPYPLESLYIHAAAYSLSESTVLSLVIHFLA